MIRSVAILFALILVAAVSTLRAQVKECIIDERFRDNNLGWPEDVNQNFSASVCAGIYTIKHNRTSGSQAFDITSKLYPGRNFFIEAEGRIKQGDKSNGFGIVWGKGSNGFFSFVITQNGTFYVREAKAGGKGEYLVNPTLSKHINKGNATNKIRVQYQQDEYVFFINDNFAAHIPFERFYGDNLGVILYGRQEAEITRFGVYGTKKYVAVSAEPVQMKISGYAINDALDSDGTKLGNGNARINHGETIKMAVSLKNVGRTAAHDMSVYVTSENQRIRVFDSGKKIPIATTDPNETAKITFKFYVADDFNGNDISFKIDIVDPSGNLAESMSFKAPLNTSMPTIDNQDNTLSVTINFKENPSNDINTSFPTTLNRSDNTAAIIIGVENYQYLPKSSYSGNDARIFFNYMAKVLNIPRQNIILITDQNATCTAIHNIFKPDGKLEHISLNRIDNVIFYFSGLGAVDPQTSAPYIMAYDSRANNAVATGYPISEIFKTLQSLRPKSAICFFETSFAGVDRNGNAFENNGGTFWSLPSLPILTTDNMAALYASAGEQAAPLYEQSQHGLFTHWILSTIRASALQHSTLSMKTLFSNVSREMMKECTKRGITVVPKLDCINKDIITILK